MADLLERKAARVLLLDHLNRLLLFLGADPAHPEHGTWWITPGGGLNAGESEVDAARRELFEETGLRAVALEGPVWHRVAEFDFAGERYRQSEVFFLLRVDVHEVDTSGFDPIERVALVDHRWWTLEELAATDEIVYPRELAVELARIVDDGLPDAPYEVA
jgi:8-oxo-dGTP pyrophosphatase MutT (NUDIX family)